MTESTTREARAVPPTSPNGLLTPTESPLNEIRRPSFQSDVTRIENKEDIPEFRDSLRRQTFKIQRKPSLWDWIKGAFNREAFMRRLEDSVRIVQPDSPSKYSESEFIVNVLVSRKVDSTRYEKVRCLLDTGCFSGNLVTRQLVESLGYVEADFQPPTPFENKGVTLTGEPFNIEGVIFLSWHHGSSPIIYRKMRFLIISSSKFEMIIGSDTITKHGLLVPPVFNTGAVDEVEEDPLLLEPKINHRKIHAKIQDDERFLDREKKKPEAQRDTRKIRRVEDRLPKQRHICEVLQHRLDAITFQSKGKIRDAQRAEALAKDKVEAWNIAHSSENSVNSTSAKTQSSQQKSAHMPVKRGSGHSGS